MKRRPSGPTVYGDDISPESLVKKTLYSVVDPEKSTVTSGPETQYVPTRSRRQNGLAWKPSWTHNGPTNTLVMTNTSRSQSSSSSSSSSATSLPSALSQSFSPAYVLADMDLSYKTKNSRQTSTTWFSRRFWSSSTLILTTTIVGVSLLCLILYSLTTRQLDPKGCRMSYMRPSYIKLAEFDTEHTRFATKYSIYLYREQGIDDEHKLRGVPVLFIPGNAGSYKQVRPIAAETANYFHDVLQQENANHQTSIRNLDFFTIDFNEDITAFHGQTLLDQAEYANEAIRFILSLYMDARATTLESDLPDPTSVIVLGHSMGGIVARAMLVLPNYQTKSINTIITMSAPHSRSPITFDRQIVQIYDNINSYWRQAYSQKWASDNPLWHVTLVSIAGGGLDTVVPSDYASLESLVPETHGFTVFTSTIPTVWSSMDHQAILWCDQFRKVVARALYGIVDVSRASQTRPRADRMRVFRKLLLSGMEEDAERSLPGRNPTILLTVSHDSSAIVPHDERLVLRSLGSNRQQSVSLLQISPLEPSVNKKFVLLTDATFRSAASVDAEDTIEVLVCSVLAHQLGPSTSALPIEFDFSSPGKQSTSLSCRSAASDLVLLPASTRTTMFPFSRERDKQATKFSYITYELDDMIDNQFVAIIDKTRYPSANFVIAEFLDDSSKSTTILDVGIWQLLFYGVEWKLPLNRPLVSDVEIKSLSSSLLSYNLDVISPSREQDLDLFAPLVRQHTSRPYESKYFVNFSHAEISLHGEAPFVPPPLETKSKTRGLTFQFWTDPTCNSEITMRLSFDMAGSLGKLYMRYRTVLAAFPLFITTLVLSNQFRSYDSSGAFLSFSESLDACLSRTIPVILLCLTALSVGIVEFPPQWLLRLSLGRSAPPVLGINFNRNDLLTGTQDPIFWFVIPLVGSVSVGICVALHYTTLILTHVLCAVYDNALCHLFSRAGERKKVYPPLNLISPPRRRLITTGILLFFVSTFIPYQFAYLVACMVQLFTTIRALRAYMVTSSTANGNFYHFAHSILLLMLWVLPLNLPILAVWVRNLAVQWLTPFSSHHNVLSIMPFILLVENMASRKMVPRVTSWLRHVTTIIFTGTGLYAAVYGVSYAYMLHHLVNLASAWIVTIHLTLDFWSTDILRSIFWTSTTQSLKESKSP